MVAKWLNRNRSVGALCIWQVEYLLLTCQQHRLVVYFTSKNDTQKVAPYILSIHIPPCPTSFRPLPFGLKLVSFGRMAVWASRRVRKT